MVVTTPCRIRPFPKGPVRGRPNAAQLGDEEQIDERLARRAHELEGRLAKFGTAGFQKPKDLLEFVNNLKYNKTVGSQQLEAVGGWHVSG